MVSKQNQNENLSATYIKRVSPSFSYNEWAQLLNQLGSLIVFLFSDSNESSWNRLETGIDVVFLSPLYVCRFVQITITDLFYFLSTSLTLSFLSLLPSSVCQCWKQLYSQPFLQLLTLVQSSSQQQTLTLKLSILVNLDLLNF